MSLLGDPNGNVGRHSAQVVSPISRTLTFARAAALLFAFSIPLIFFSLWHRTQYQSQPQVLHKRAAVLGKQSLMNIAASEQTLDSRNSVHNSQVKIPPAPNDLRVTNNDNILVAFFTDSKGILHQFQIDFQTTFATQIGERVHLINDEGLLIGTTDVRNVTSQSLEDQPVVHLSHMLDKSVNFLSVQETREKGANIELVAYRIPRSNLILLMEVEWGVMDAPQRKINLAFALAALILILTGFLFYRSVQKVLDDNVADASTIHQVKIGLRSLAIYLARHEVQLEHSTIESAFKKFIDSVLETSLSQRLESSVLSIQRHAPLPNMTEGSTFRYRYNSTKEMIVAIEQFEGVHTPAQLVERMPGAPGKNLHTLELTKTLNLGNQASAILTNFYIPSYNNISEFSVLDQLTLELLTKTLEREATSMLLCETNAEQRRAA
jgi:hypothetical protein